MTAHPIEDSMREEKRLPFGFEFYIDLIFQTRRGGTSYLPHISASHTPETNFEPFGSKYKEKIIYNIISHTHKII